MVNNKNKTNVFYMPLDWNECYMLKDIDKKYIKKLIKSFKYYKNDYTTEDFKKQKILKKYRESIVKNVLT